MSFTKPRRTTIFLQPIDQENLLTVTRKQGVTDTEAIRRALRLMAGVIEWEENGTHLAVEEDGRFERIHFI